MSWFRRPVEHACSRDTLSSSSGPAFGFKGLVVRNRASRRWGDVCGDICVWPGTILKYNRNPRTGFPKVMMHSATG